METNPQSVGCKRSVGAERFGNDNAQLRLDAPEDSSMNSASDDEEEVPKTDLKPKVRVTLYSSKEITRKDIEGDYVLQVSSKQYIDAKDKSNFVGRYINSMKGTGRQPNVRFGTGYRVSKKTINGETRYTIPIITIKKIKPNTELLLDYGKGYHF